MKLRKLTCYGFEKDCYWQRIFLSKNKKIILAYKLYDRNLGPYSSYVYFNVFKNLDVSANDKNLKLLQKYLK